jgi:hypothetical protein
VSPINKVRAIVAKKPFFDGHFQLFIKRVRIDRIIFIVIFYEANPLKAKIISSYSGTIVIISFFENLDESSNLHTRLV